MTDWLTVGKQAREAWDAPRPDMTGAFLETDCPGCGRHVNAHVSPDGLWCPGCGHFWEDQ